MGESPAAPATHNPWRLYDALIDGIPDDVAVTRLCLGPPGPTSRPKAAWAWP